MTTAPGVADALAIMRDPLNRFYRYPLATWLLRWVTSPRITPNHVTAAAAVLGVAAALLVTCGTRWALVAAGLLWEIHMVLDCLDGVLARARNATSARGHTLDMIGDSIAYLACAATMWWFVRTTAPGFPAGLLTFATVASGALAAWAHDFYLRKFTAALTIGTDPVYEDLSATQRAIASGGGFVAWFGWVFAWLQVIGLQPSSRRDIAARLRVDAPPAAPGESPEVRSIRARADTPRARRAFRAVSFVSNDNNQMVLGLGLATGGIMAAQIVATLYATLSLVAGIACCQAFLRSAGRSS